MMTGGCFPFRFVWDGIEWNGMGHSAFDKEDHIVIRYVSVTVWAVTEVDMMCVAWRFCD